MALLIKLTWLLALSCTVLSLPNFHENLAERSENEENKIIDGRTVQTIPPYMVALLSKGYSTLFCTATLISADRILTAANCFDNAKKEGPMHAVLGLKNVTQASILASTVNPNVSVMEFVLEDVVKYSSYTNKKAEGDIAIIKLKSSVKQIFKPIALASKSPLEEPFDVMMKAMGWGLKNCKDSSAEALLEAIGGPSTSAACSEDDFNITEDKFCMAYEKNGAVAPGDIGGPVVFDANAKNPIQVGIASWGLKNKNNNCVDTSKPSAYTAVARYQDFIKKNAPGAKFSS